MADIVLANSLFRDAGAFSKLQKNVTEVLGPSGIDARRFIVIAQRVVTHNPRLLQCTALSVASSIMESAIWGLDLNPAAGQAYLVPYNNMIEGADGKKHKQMECTLQVGYKGFEALAWREAKILMPSACVYQGDKFRVTLGSNPHIEHEPKLAANDRGRLVAVYARAVFPDGRELIAVHDVAEIERRRKCSKAADGDAWGRFYDAMARKGPVRQLGSTQVPYSFAPKLQQAAMADEYREIGVQAHVTPEAEERAHEVIGGRNNEAEGAPDGSPPPSNAQPQAPAEWFPKEPGDDCMIGPVYFQSRESRSKGPKSWWVFTTAEGDQMNTWDEKLAGATPIETELLAAWTTAEKGTRTYKNLAAVLVKDTP